MEYITESNTKTRAHLPRIFERLSPCVVQSSPVPVQPYTGDEDEPELIVFCSWMGANPRHIRKYATYYGETYPNAVILIVTTSVVDLAVRSKSAHSNRIRPAIEKIKRTLCEANATKRNPRILLHILSNGGAYTACRIADTFRKEVGNPLPITGMILDSCPGRGNFEQSIAAISINLPKAFLLRHILLLAASLLLAYLWVLDRVLQVENKLDRSWYRMNDERLFDLRACRLYVYSKADAIIHWRDIEDHAEMAKKIGWTVIEMRYEDSAHVCLLRDKPELYWAAAQGIWEIGFKSL
jgi:hypothetical protein